MVWYSSSKVKHHFHFGLGNFTYLEQLNCTTLQMKIGKVMVLLTETSK